MEDIGRKFWYWKLMLWATDFTLIEVELSISIFLWKFWICWLLFWYKFVEETWLFAVVGIRWGVVITMGFKTGAIWLYWFLYILTICFAIGLGGYTNLIGWGGGRKVRELWWWCKLVVFPSKDENRIEGLVDITYIWFLLSYFFILPEVYCGGKFMTSGWGLKIVGIE